MKLYLMRHGEADDTWPDPNRQLTHRGIKRSMEVAGLLKQHGVTPDVKVVSSSYTRAKQTAAAVREVLGSTCGEIVWDGVTPDDATEPLALQLCSVSEDLVLVGHNPLFSMLASRLLTGQELGMAVSFKKSGCMFLERIDPYRKDNRIPPAWVLRAYWIP
ncbi:MAG: phosphohistidine phosphatase SixA [Verrucomicrobia bacterium]|nr:phosphohistidine phosphatase SixA [Verrucomicrobiota bacterium]